MGTQELFHLSTIKLLLTGIRPLNIFIIIASIICALAKLHIIDLLQIIFPIIIVSLIAIIGNLTNDLFDIEIDKINRPERILAKYPEMKKYFMNLIFFCCFLLCAILPFVNYKSQIIVIITLPAMLAYSYFLKGVPIMGNLLIAFYLGFVFSFTEITTMNEINLMIIPSCFAFGISLIREIIKDAEDIDGDSMARLKTLPIVIGLRKTINIVLILIIGFIVFCASTFFDGRYFYYEMSMIFLVFMPLFYLIFFLLKKPTLEALHHASLLLKKITILGLLIIYML